MPWPLALKPLALILTNVHGQFLAVCCAIQGTVAVSPVQKLCLLKLVRPDCLVAAIQQYVITSLGPQFAEPGPVSLQSVQKDSNNTTPIIFILSPGGPKPLFPLLSLYAALHLGWWWWLQSWWWVSGVASVA